MASRSPRTSRHDKSRGASNADPKAAISATDPPSKDASSAKGGTSFARVRFWLAVLVLLGVLGSAYPIWRRYQDWAEFDRARRMIDDWDLVRGMRAAEAFRAKHKTLPAATWLVARGYRRSQAHDDAEKELGFAEQLGYPKQEIELERLMLTAARGNVDPLLRRVESPFPLPDYYFSDSCASLATGYMTRLDWTQAIRWLDKWSRVEVNQPEALNRMGAVYHRAMDYDKAQKKYMEVLKRWPRNRTANLEIGDDMIRNNNFTGALDHFVIVAEDDPESASVWRRICICNIMRGELDYAEEAAERMRPMALRNGEVETDLMLLDLRIALRRNEESRDAKEATRIAHEFEEYLAARPADLPARFDYGKALALAGRFKDAEEQKLRHSQMVDALMKADELMGKIMHDPNDVDSRVEYAKCISEAGDSAAAQTVLQSVIERDVFRQDAVDLSVKLFRDSNSDVGDKAADELLKMVEEERSRLGPQSPRDPQASQRSPDK